TVGKTSRHIWEAAHLILGLDLYGRKVLRPGPVLFLMKDDSRKDFEWRLARVLEAMHLTPADQRRVTDNMFFHDLLGTNERLAHLMINGNLARTDLAERVITAYKTEGLSMINIDPLRQFSPGARFLNDAEAECVGAGKYIASSLTCCVRLTHHISQEA